MSDQGNTVCRRNCWLVGGISAAVLWLALVMLAGYPPGQGLVIAVILFLLLSLFLIWAFCSGAEAVADQVAPVAARPVPAPAPPATPIPAAPMPAAAAPAAAVMADPVASAPVSPPAPPVAVAAVTARPDPGTAAKPKAKAAKPAKAAAPKAVTKSAAAPAAKAAPKPAATNATAAADATTQKAAPAAKSAKPRAAGLDAVIGRTKETAPAEPTLLQRPRGDKGDDLKLIVGVGPVLEKLMNGIGVWHFDQIAAWKAADIALVDSKMGSFRGRITRDGWVKQARNLARGKPPTGGAE